MSSSVRDQPGAKIRYFSPKHAPTDPMEALLLGEKKGETKEEFKARRQELTEAHEVDILDARSHNGGLDSWKLDENGFAFIRAPEPLPDMRDRPRVKKEYYPRLVEQVLKSTGASRCFVMSHLLRTEKPITLTEAYARFAHADYGPEYEPLFRKTLVELYGVPEEEANTCGICASNVWTPMDRPAYRDPLCLLDCSTVDLDKEMVRFLYIGNDEMVSADGSKMHRSAKNASARPTVPTAGAAAAAMGPMYAPKHRWVFCPDMGLDEAILFKQYDSRKGVRAQTSFHNSFHDTFHDGHDMPGRRSCEFRLLLTFDQNSVGGPGGGASSKL